MTILALDTSSKAASCALLRDGALLAEAYLNVGLTHSQTALALVEDMLARSGTAAEQVDRFAVSVGPGSFTGLRIGIAAVKGMALALDRPCAGISTLEALAENVRIFSGLAVPVMDARRGQVYTATFSCKDGVVRRLCDDRAVGVEQLRDELSVCGEAVLLLGDGASLCRKAMEGLPHVTAAPEPLRYQRASSVAMAAARQSEKDCTSAEALTPVYLRLPQAERERLAKLNSRKEGRMEP